MANSVVHFEIFATDVERTRKFYEQVFGWSFEAGGSPDFYHMMERKSIGEIAEAVGYDSAAAFSTDFKQCFGVPPSNYLAG